jgi:ferric-dicitrate binding protein FerR (iron transport regulator)
MGVGSGVTAEDIVGTGHEVVAAFVLAGGTSLRVNEESRLRIISGNALVLERGSVYLDTGAAAPGVGVEVRTPLGVIRDVGTRFEVLASDGRVRVRVRDGEIVFARGTSTATATRGTELSVDAGVVMTRTIPLFGEEWAWLAKTPEKFALEGRSLADFLEWVSRETGFTVVFEADGLAARARGMTLQGSIDGLTAEESLDVVLPAVGLHPRIDAGRLWIGAQ